MEEKQPHAGMGIASLVLAAFAIVNVLLMIVVVDSVGATYQARTQIDTPYHTFLGGWSVGIALLSVCGIVFGIGGVRQQNRRHALATLGLCLNIAIPIGIMFTLLMVATLHPELSNDASTTPTPYESVHPAWQSSIAQSLQCLTVGIAAASAMHFWRKRRAGKSAESSEIIDSTPAIQRTIRRSKRCLICKKPMPTHSRFCARCGKSLPRIFVPPSVADFGEFHPMTGERV